MAETVEIREDLLYPGDTIRFDFLVTGSNETLIGLGARKIKETIYTDDRLDYQGSEETNPVDLETGRASRILSVYATVRKYRRNIPVAEQQAGIGAVAVGVLVGAIIGAVVAYACLSYKSYAIVRVVSSSASEEVKAQAIDAIKSSGSVLGSLGVGAIAAVGIGAYLLLRK
jgi:hypothetical protein